MVAPILEEGQTTRNVYLPEDMTMVRFDGDTYECVPVKRGDLEIEVELNEVVFFILKDKLVPVGEDLILLGNGTEYELYEDDGLTKEYSLDNIRILRK